MAQVPTPTVTPRLREQARQAPGTWIYAVDPAFEDAADVPAWAVVGAYRVDERGEIGEEFTGNPNYRPTPLALGFPAPANELEAALQRAVTGHGGDIDIRAAMPAATVFIPHRDGGPGIAGPEAGPERPTVRAYTSERYLPDSDRWRHWERMPLRELAGALGGGDLLLNPGSELELRLSTPELT